MGTGVNQLEVLNVTTAAHCVTVEVDAPTPPVLVRWSTLRLPPAADESDSIL
jgi:hypothetical protein